MPLPISNTEYVYCNLRREIIYGELEPGQRLLIRELSQRFGTSNTPVIEAIRRLEQDGLIVSRVNAGAQVREWTAQEIVRAYLTREVVDGVAARLFVAFATDEQRAELTRLNENYHRVVEGDETATQRREAEAAYHLHVVQATLPWPMQNAMESICAITMTFLSAFPSALSQPYDPCSHDALTGVLLGDDPQAAETKAREHVRGALNHLLEINVLEASDVSNTVELTESLSVFL